MPPPEATSRYRKLEGDGGVASARPSFRAYTVIEREGQDEFLAADRRGVPAPRRRPLQHRPASPPDRRPRRPACAQRRRRAAPRSTRQQQQIRRSQPVSALTSGHPQEPPALPAAFCFPQRAPRLPGAVAALTLNAGRLLLRFFGRHSILWMVPSGPFLTSPVFTNLCFSKKRTA